METKLTIGERLKDLRVERDMNQEEQQLRALCKQVGTDFDSLNKADVAATMRILRELTPKTTQQGRAVRKSMDKQLRGKTRRKQ